MVSQVMFSKKSDLWTTPDRLFQAWNRVFQFTVDVAASDENAKCAKYYTEATDGLVQSWNGERVFCNPPYSNVTAWVDKAIEETMFRQCDLVFLLLPSRTDQEWFRKLERHQYCDRWFFRGRINFSGGKSGAPFPSIAAVIYGRHVRELK